VETFSKEKKKLPRVSVHTTVVVSPYPLSPAPSASSAIKISEITEEDPNVPEPADEGDIQIEYC